MEAAKAGPRAGYPMCAVIVTLLDESRHEGSSSAAAFKSAAIEAFRQGCIKGTPVLLEPIMMVDVVAPDAMTSQIISDLSSRGGQIEANMLRGSSRVIRAYVALAQLFGYAMALRSLSQGRAVSTMEAVRYERVRNH